MQNPRNDKAPTSSGRRFLVAVNKILPIINYRKVGGGAAKYLMEQFIYSPEPTITAAPSRSEHGHGLFSKATFKLGIMLPIGETSARGSVKSWAASESNSVGYRAIYREWRLDPFCPPPTLRNWRIRHLVVLYA
jgi:hypothetical protein